MASAFADLLDHVRKTHVLSSAASILAWDQETGMPAGGGDLRARQLSALAALAHELATDPRVDGWLLECEADAAVLEDPDQAANVREIRRDFDRATRLPASLVAELAGLESRAQQVWAKARAESDFPLFAPLLQRMLELQRAKADCLVVEGRSRWDSLADLYEPGMNAAQLRELFGPLRQQLVALRERLDRAGVKPDGSFAKAEFAAADQESFVREVLAAMGFDFERGRLDRSAHPFCTGSGGDVRLTTRFAKDNVLDALGSTMHEGGHGIYEQGLPADQQGTPLGEAVSLGIHESQSRLWENHVGRSSSFWHWALPVARRHLGPALDSQTADRLFRAANLVTPSLIRVEADEATYDLHIMVRFELETALLSGDLSVDDLPARWNALYRDYLGVEVPDDRRGCLQDVHWSCGLFGYFPTYTLGNLYAAQFASSADRALGGLDDLMARGDFAPLRGWLRENVHRHGRRHLPAELCELATGRPLSSGPFLTYLAGKLERAYDVA
jgi:carboxypeptidase Taq